MPDLITYSANTSALMDELEQNHPHLYAEDPDTGDRIFKVDKVPVIRNGDRTLSIVRVSPAVATELQSLSNLFVVTSVIYNSNKAARFKTNYNSLPAIARQRYEEVYSRATVTVSTIDGGTTKYVPPLLFGSFAGFNPFD